MKTVPLHFKIDDDVELHLLEERDAAGIFALVEKDRLYLREWLPWVDQTRSVADELAFIQMAKEQHHNNDGFGCSIWYKKQITGTISYHPINWRESKVEIGYWLGADFQGKGLMTKACRTMIDYAFHELKLKKVEIRCATANTRSNAIPQRLSFRSEAIIEQGEWLYDHYVDLVLYGMLASEWKKKA